LLNEPRANSKQSIKDILVKIARPDLNVYSIEITDTAINDNAPFNAITKVKILVTPYRTRSRLKPST